MLPPLELELALCCPRSHLVEPVPQRVDRLGADGDRTSSMAEVPGWLVIKETRVRFGGTMVEVGHVATLLVKETSQGTCRMK